MRRQANDDHDITLDIQREIAESMYFNENGAKTFICRSRIEQIWSRHSIRDIPGFGNFTIDERNDVRSSFMLVLSIVIYMGWSELQRFRAVFMRTGLDDSGLFFTEDQLINGLGRVTRTFLATQYQFKPAIIQRKREAFKQIIESSWRLPFTQEEFLGQGGFGSVTRRTVAPRCFSDEVTGTRENSEVCMRPLYLC